MKTIRLVTSLAFLFCLSSLKANENFNWEDILRTQLNKMIGNTDYQFQSLSVDTDNKSLSGVGTFFGKPNIAFTLEYESDASLAHFSTTFPSNAKVGVSNNSLTKLAGQSLDVMIPDAIKKSLYLEHFNFSFSKEDKRITFAELHFNAFNQWEFFQGSSFGMDNIQVKFAVQDPTQKEKRELAGRLTGNVHFKDSPILMSADLQRDKQSLQLRGNIRKIGFMNSLHTIVGKTSINGFTLPDPMINLSLKEADLVIAPYQKWTTLDANSNIGKVQLWAQQNEAKKKDKLEYVATISPPSGFKISKLNSKLTALDGLNLAGQKIVLSSADKDKKESSKIPSMAQISSGIKKGCSLLARIDLRKIKMDHLLGIKELIVQSPLSSKLEHMVLEGEIDKEVALGPTTKLQQVIFRLKPGPKNFAVSLLGVMDAKVQSDALKFKGGVEIAISDQSINFLSIMDGVWNNPLGAKGLVMQNVGLQMGASITAAPVILPNMALTGKVKIGDFLGDAALAFDSRNPTKSMMAVSFDELILNDLMELVISDKVSKKLPEDLKKMMKSIRLMNVEMEVVPQALQVLERNYNPGFRAKGMLDFNGWKGESELDIDYTNGILMKGAIDPINLKVFKIQGADGQKRPSITLDLRKNGNQKAAINGLINVLGLEAQTDVELMANGYRFMVGGKIFNVFNGKIDASGKNLDKAGDMFLKVTMEQDLLGFVEREVIKFVENSTGKAIKKIAESQRKVTALQKQLKVLDKEIKAMRNKVDKEMAADRKKIAANRKKVNDAQKKVNTLKNTINKYKRQIKKLRKTQVAKRIKLETQLRSTQVAHGSATTALNAAKLVLKGFDGLNTNPDADARVIALKTKKNTAYASLEVWNGTLEATKKTLGFSGKTITFLVDKGTDALINVRKADFEGKLNNLSSGAVKLNMDIEWLGKKKNVKINFNFDDPKKAVVEMAKGLLKKK